MARPTTYLIEYDDTAKVEAAAAEYGEQWYDHIDPFSVRESVEASNDLWVAKGTCTHLMKSHKAIVLYKREIECFDTEESIEVCYEEDRDVVNGWWE